MSLSFFQQFAKSPTKILQKFSENSFRGLTSFFSDSPNNPFRNYPKHSVRKFPKDFFTISKEMAREMFSEISTGIHSESFRKIP